MSDQYLFRESEFEDENFHPAAFVAKYRRITSLESLRDQLRQYSSSLKDQLYEIINRDYKDFIKISSKLEGVDSRVEHLRQPLSDLKLDVVALHNGMVSRLRAIEDKISQKFEISIRRHQLEACVSCMEKLDTVEEILNVQRINLTNNNSSSTSQASILLQSKGIQSKRHQMILSLQQSYGSEDFQTLFCDGVDDVHNNLFDFETAFDPLPAHSNSTSASRFVSSTTSANEDAASQASLAVLQCSEYERAAYALSEALSQLHQLQLSNQQQLQQQRSVNYYDSSALGNPNSSQSLYKTLELRSTKLKNDLILVVCQRLTAVLDAMTVTRDSASEPQTNPLPPRTIPTADKHYQRAFLHCVRALVALSHGADAENVIAEHAVNPLARSLLSQGRVDGSGGRGSYSGLQDILQHLLASIAARIDSLLILVETTIPSPLLDSPRNEPNSPRSAPALDLLVNGVWSPVIAVVLDRFPSMLNVGIAPVLHKCFTALEEFTESVGSLGIAPLGGERGDIEWRKVVRRRMLNHPVVRAFNSKWGVEIYFQLRSQEICQRIDVVCTLIMKQKITANVYDAVSSSNDSSSSATAIFPAVTTGLSAEQTSSIPSSLSAKDVGILRMKIQTALSSLLQARLFADETVTIFPVFEFFCLELECCVHKGVILSPLTGRFFTLALQIMNRLEVFLAQWTGVSSPAFNRDSILAADANSAGSNAPDSNIALSSTSTPIGVKPASSATAVTTTPPPRPLSNMGANSIESTALTTPANPPTTEEILQVIFQYKVILEWLNTSFLETTITRLLDAATTDVSYDSVAVPVKKCFSRQYDRGHRTVRSLWGKVYFLLDGECKQALQGVRSLAGKYRMTNKPPPETASPYVSSILQPIRQFKEKYSFLNPIPLSQATHTATASNTNIIEKYNELWEKEIIEKVTANYLNLVKGLMETVRQMDTALLRRNKMGTVTVKTGSKAGSSGGPMSDSEKIQLQLLLDVRAYGLDLQTLNFDPKSSPSYNQLLNEVTEANNESTKDTVDT